MKKLRLRTVLYAPGNNELKIKESARSRADAVILDLEDTVPLHEKDAARKIVKKAIKSLQFGTTHVLARINSVDDTEMFVLDLDAIVHPNLRGIRIPKVESEKEVREVSRKLDNFEKERGLTIGGISLLPIVESPKGLLNAYSIAKASPRNLAISVGMEDFTAEMGIERTNNQFPLLHAKFHLSMCAIAAEIIPLDSVFMNVEDEEGLIQEARLARSLGYLGKCLIDSRQIKPVQSVFTPSKEEIEKAGNIIRAFEEGMAKGSGLVMVDGSMVDLPVLKRARRVLNQAES